MCAATPTGPRKWNLWKSESRFQDRNRASYRSHVGSYRFFGGFVQLSFGLVRRPSFSGSTWVTAVVVMNSKMAFDLLQFQKHNTEEFQKQVAEHLDEDNSLRQRARAGEDHCGES